MAWPPDPIAADLTNETVAEDTHPDHHNELAEAINDLVDYVDGLEAGGGGGDFVKLAEIIIGTGGSSAASSVSFDSIPDAYTSLLLVYQVNKTNFGGSAISLRFNDDDGENYSQGASNDLTSLLVHDSNQGGSSGIAAGQMSIPHYARNDTFKGAQWTAAGRVNAGNSNVVAISNGGIWNDTDPIDKITLFHATHSFTAGTVLVLYGRA